VLPTYNELDNGERILQSLCRCQQRFILEILFVDDD